MAQESPGRAVSSYDTIIIGAGHNGLVCAAYLAAAGQRLLVLEASSSAGGLAETREFHPGFRASVAHTISQFSPAIAADLKLASHGYTAAARALDAVEVLDDSGIVGLSSDIALRSDGRYAVSYEDSANGFIKRNLLSKDRDPQNRGST